MSLTQKLDDEGREINAFTEGKTPHNIKAPLRVHRLPSTHQCLHVIRQ